MKKWYYSIAAKTGIFVVLFMSVALAIGSVLSCVLLWSSGVYTMTKRMMIWDVFEEMATEDYYQIRYLETGQADYESIFFQESNFSYEIFNEDGKKTAGNYDGTPTSYAYEFEWSIITAESYETVEAIETTRSAYDEGQYEPFFENEIMQPTEAESAPWSDAYHAAESDKVKENESTIETMVVKLYINEELPVNDKYAFMASVISIAYGVRYWIYPIIILFAILSLVCFILLLCGAGHRNGKEEIQERVLVKLPLEIYGFGVCSAAVLLYACLIDTVRHSGYAIVFTGFILFGSLLFVITVGCCMNLAVRAKTGQFWSNTLTARLWHFSGGCCHVLLRGLRIMVRAVPMAWRVIVSAIAIFILEFFILTAWSYDAGDVITLFVLEKMLVLMLLLYLVYCLRTLQQGGKALAEGNLSYRIDSKGMFGDFKEHANDLNSIRDGMSAAVNEQMKSERMKTELITNVSHDIKTPLTSIINYTDLIVKEQSENEKINEYAKVLERQSARLKKLIEDLVEASKASTGNLEVSLTPMEVGVMATQVAGEYTERLAARNLTLVTKQPEEDVRIMADGRHLWRVLDNLMNNVCKYAQPGTRVYLSVEKKSDKVRIILKNTSEYALDVEAEELMERFVRGDESRSTEGNGLGLSIAQSLTELQKGQMQLTVDGDLFKIVLEFPAM